MLEKCKMRARKVKESYKKAEYWLLSEPKRLVRLILLSICGVVVIFQLSDCVKKLLLPPISTHSHFDLNQTMAYPALTFCRDPPYKLAALQKYNLSHHPKHTPFWRFFPFDRVNLDDFFEEIVYSREETFAQYALDGQRTNVAVDGCLQLNTGKCYTVRPKVKTVNAWKDAGYSILLTHDVDSPDDTPTHSMPGWHVYIHEPKEIFTENGMQSSGRVEYFFLGVGEELEMKITVQDFQQMRGRGGTCSDEIEHGTSACNETCKWMNVTETVGCSAPFMRHAAITKRNCNNFDDMRELILTFNYRSNIKDLNCMCLDPCHNIIYSAFVVNRKTMRPENSLNSQLYLYYTSKMVSNIEELSGYDLNQFISDMGGSLGFLLGLSVIGFIKVFEWMMTKMCLNKLVDKYKEKLEEEKPEKPEKSEKCEGEPKDVFVLSYENHLMK